MNKCFNPILPAFLMLALLSPLAHAGKSHDTAVVMVSVVVVNPPTYESVMASPDIQDVEMPAVYQPPAPKVVKLGGLHSERFGDSVLKTEL